MGEGRGSRVGNWEQRQARHRPVWQRPGAGSEVSVDSSPESHLVPHPPGMTLKRLPVSKVTISPHGMPDAASSLYHSVLLNVYCFLNQRHVSDSWRSSLTTAFFRILVPSSLTGARPVVGACEKPERSPEWVSRENRTPTFTHLCRRGPHSRELPSGAGWQEGAPGPRWGGSVSGLSAW